MDSIGPASGMSAKAMEKNVGALKAAMDVQQQMVGQLLEGIAPAPRLSADTVQVSPEGQAMLAKEMGAA